MPDYAQAHGHLAEVEAQLGEIESAVASLDSLAASTDDPDYAAQLARILADAGRDGEASHWRRLAAERYEELLAKHPEAFAGQAAEFWLAAGADPDKALQLAKINLEVRNTPWARRLLAQAVAAKASFGGSRSWTRATRNETVSTVPTGRCDNSPAFQRRDRPSAVSSPEEDG